LMVAVCITGHLRTFVLKGVFSGIHKHLLTAPGIQAGVFLLGHLGSFQGSADARATAWTTPVVSSANDTRLTEAALPLLRPFIKHLELTDGGDCQALEASWASSRIPGSYNPRTWSCLNEGGYLQVMWMDRAIQEAMHSGDRYDVMLRTRPDVGVFAPIAWSQVSPMAVNFMPKDAGGKSDWFFVVAWSLIESWWDETIIPGYKDRTLGGCCPDYVIFDRGEQLQQMDFPVVIVRDSQRADCFRLVSNFDLRQACFEKLGNGFWDRMQSGVHGPSDQIISDGGNRAVPFPWQRVFMLACAFLAVLLSSFIDRFSFKSCSPSQRIGLAFSVLYLSLSLTLDVMIAVMKRSKSPGFSFNPLCVNMTVEVVKLGLSCILLAIDGCRTERETSKAADAKRQSTIRILDVVWICFAGILFAATNFLVYASIGANTLGVFGVLRELLIVWTAMVWRCVFRTSLGTTRLLSLGAIVLGAALASYSAPASNGANPWQWWPCMLVVSMTICNALASVANEFALKSSFAVNTNLQNMILYLTCLLTLSLGLWVYDAGRFQRGRFFAGFTHLTWVTIGLQACAGLVVSRVFKHTDAIYKCASAALRAPLLVFLGMGLEDDGTGRGALTLFASAISTVGAIVYLWKGHVKAATDAARSMTAPEVEVELARTA